MSNFIEFKDPDHALQFLYLIRNTLTSSETLIKQGITQEMALKLFYESVFSLMDTSTKGKILQ